VSRDKVLVTGNFELPMSYASHDVIHLRVPRDDRQVIDHLAGVRHYIIGGPEFVDDRILAHAHALRHVVAMGTQLSSFIDVEPARARGITVENTPGINADAVAEFAVGMTIVHLARAFASYQNVLEGTWAQRPHHILSEARIGIVGLGNIGTRIATKLRAISSAELCYFSRTRKPEFERQHDLRYLPLQALFAHCDAILVCVTHDGSSHGLIGHDILRAAQREPILLNLCHPFIVDPAAARDALESRRIGLYYLDGYYNEWHSNQGLAQDPFRLLALGPSRFIATEHVAAQSEHINQQLLKAAFEKVASWIANHHRTRQGV
jgi:glyoxylate reductase